MSHRLVLQLALEARICVNSARKVLRGERLRGDAGARAAEVMAQHGWEAIQQASKSSPPPHAA